MVWYYTTFKYSPETTISSILPGINMQVLSYINSCENVTQSTLEWVVVSWRRSLLTSTILNRNTNVTVAENISLISPLALSVFSGQAKNGIWEIAYFGPNWARVSNNKFFPHQSLKHQSKNSAQVTIFILIWYKRSVYIFAIKKFP